MAEDTSTSAPEPPPLRAERREHTLILTLDREARRNALSRALVDALLERIDAIPEDPSIRGVILTGAGDRAFCAGADLREREHMTDIEVRTFLDDLGRLMNSVAALPVPVIAAINGFALGGGLELALACDLRIASENATMGLTEVRLGIIPGAGGTQRLARLLGPARAKELVLTARRVPAPQALQLGIISDVCPTEELLDRAFDLTDEIAQAAPLAIARAKEAIDRGFGLPLPDALKVEREAYEPLLETSDRVEALRAFREHRPPRFTGS